MDLPFRVSAGILALKMQTLMQTVTLLQLFKIFPKEGTCAKCDHKVIGEVKQDNNYLFWWCSDCRFKTPVRQGTVLSNSNMKLDRFVMLIFAFVNRGHTYQQIINDACLPMVEGFKECSMSFSTISK